MRFLADMGISPEAVACNHVTGHDAVHVAERDYHRRADADILELARSEERIVLTHDLGFGALMSASGLALPSVVIFRLGDMRPASVINHLHLITVRYRAQLEAGAILSVTERRIRVRPLPL
jgi:predicted nuclease of predicted toxin-antitoxin system